ncbi:MAG: glutathione-disulfide reductase [Bradyrhizobium sp.]|nr:MAG: glutathione-disulfide reductase [Bradyrhizobium sp.]
MDFDCDLFIVGAGSGGVRAARVAAGYGAKVIVAEEFRIGGTCVIRGCVPKKLMVYASRFADEFAYAAGYGWSVGPTSFDWPTLRAAKEREISRLSDAYRTNVGKAGATLIETRAELVDANRVRLADGRIVSARHILVATGARPESPGAIAGLEHTISSNEIFDLPEFPRRLLVVGGGYIAVEFACLFARLGAEVTQVMRGDNILRGFDQDMRDGLRDELQRAGVRLRFGCLPTVFEKHGKALRATLSDDEAIEIDQALVATGRKPNTSGLGLAEIGVALDATGAVVVDAGSTTNIRSIHAIGDVTNRINLTPVAIREGHALADKLFGDGDGKVDHHDVASAVFATPEIGAIGLTEAEAFKRYEMVDVYMANFKPMKATVGGGSERAIMKLVVEAHTNRVVGVHILARDAAEMIQVAAIAIKMKATKADFDAAMAVHPTGAEELVTMRAPTRRLRR